MVAVAQSYAHYPLTVGVFLWLITDPGSRQGYLARFAVIMANASQVSTNLTLPPPPQPADWPDFLANVDAAVPPKEVLQKAMAFLQSDCGLTEPKAAIGIQLEDLRNHPKWPSADLPLVGFLGRVAAALRGLLAAQAAPPAGPSTAAPPAATAADDALRTALQVVTGGQASAAALADALVEPVPNAMELLKQVGLGDLPHLMLPAVEVFRVLSAEVRAAKRDGRPPHAFCDLTGDPFRPVWLPIEAVGGRARGVDPEAFSSSLTGSSGSSQLEVALTRALKQAYLAGGGRFFRTLQQWSLCYQRYMLAAVATGHSTWSQLFAHMASVYRLAEASANAQQGVYLAILYDEVARREWSARAARGDNTLDILKESHSPPTDLVAAAQSRLQTVLSSAGLQRNPRRPPWATQRVTLP